MGNKPVITTSIDSFVLSANDDDTQTVDEAELLMSLFNLYRIFKNNPNAYVEFKENEEKQTLRTNIVLNQEQEEGGGNKKITKAKKYQMILLNLLLKQFKNETLYLLLFKLIGYILNEVDFLNLFMKNGLEQLCNIVLGVEFHISNNVFIEGCELLNYVLAIFQNKPALLDKQISTLFKIYSIPKKLNEKETINDYNLLRTLGKLLKNCIYLLVTLQDKAKTFKFSLQKDFFEFQKNIINDYSSTNLFINLLNTIDNEKVDNIINQLNAMLFKNSIENKIVKEIDNIGTEKGEKNEQDENDLSEAIKLEIENDKQNREIEILDIHNSFPLMVINVFQILNKIPFIFSEKIIKPENEIEKLLKFITNNESNVTENFSSDENLKVYYVVLIQEILSFLISYFISFCMYNNLYSDDCISVLYINDKDFEKKMDIFYNIFQNGANSELKFLISSFFFLLSINKNVWNYLVKKNIIKPTSYFILEYIKYTFNPNVFSESKEEFQIKLKNISKFVEILIFLSEIKIYSKIKHTSFFSEYFTPVLLLFYINPPFFRFEILNAMNFFTLYEDCKLVFSEKKNSKVQTKLLNNINELFQELTKLNQICEDLTIQKLELLQKLEKAPDMYKNKITENSDLVESFFINAKTNFNTAGSEFGYLISIFVNLMVNNHFEKCINILCNNNVDDIFLFFDNYQEIDETDGKKLNTTKKLGKFYEYLNFFLNLKSLKAELNKPLYFDITKKLSRYTFQIPLAILMFNPTSQIVVTGEKDIENDLDFSEMKGDLFNLSALIELLQQNKTDYELSHKIVFTITRFFCKQTEMKLIFDQVKRLIEELKGIIITKKVPLFLIRECFRLFCTLSIRIDNCYLWLKFDSSKTLDISNSTDVILRYMDDNLNWNKNKNTLTTKEKNSNKSTNNFNNYTYLDQNVTNMSYLNNTKTYKESTTEGRIIRLPYMKVEPYNKTMGIITYSKHYFLLPRPIILSSEMDSSFTLWFRFYNPVIRTNKWHTLLQDRNGLISLIAINSTGSRLGCFANNGDFIDSGINLNDPALKNKWVQIAVVFRSLGVMEESQVTGDLKWYVDGKPINQRLHAFSIKNNKKISYMTNKVILPDNIQYIGNSRDYSEPFGVFCDIRIYKAYKEDEDIFNLYQLDEQKMKSKNVEFDIQYILFNEVGEATVEYALENKHLSEEVLLFLIKFINNLMTNSEYRQKFVNFGFVMKLCEEGFEYRKIEIKKELTKYLQIVA